MNKLRQDGSTLFPLIAVAQGQAAAPGRKDRSSISPRRSTCEQVRGRFPLAPARQPGRGRHYTIDAGRARRRRSRCRPLRHGTGREREPQRATDNINRRARARLQRLRERGRQHPPDMRLGWASSPRDGGGARRREQRPAQGDGQGARDAAAGLRDPLPALVERLRRRLPQHRQKVSRAGSSSRPRGILRPAPERGRPDRPRLRDPHAHGPHPADAPKGRGGARRIFCFERARRAAELPDAARRFR